MKIAPHARNILLAFMSTLLAVTAVEGFLRVGLIKTRMWNRLKTEGSAAPAHKLLILGDSFIYKSGELDRFLVPKLAALNFQILNLSSANFIRC